MDDVTGPDRLLLDRIIAELRTSGEFVALVDPELAPKVRALGRRAGRLLKWKVLTHATDPAKRQDAQSLVRVVVMEDSPLRRELEMVRTRKMMERLDALLDNPPE